MQPDLAITYNGGLGNGHLGVGWTLQGLSYIQRCAKTLVDDGGFGAVRYDSSDALCLDGARLLLVSGTYGANGAEYRTRQDGFARITQRGSLQDDSCVPDEGGRVTFEVRTKDGLIHRYGTTKGVGHGLCFGEHTYRWPITQTVDRVGNSLRYEYASDAFDEAGVLTQAEYRPVAVTYSEDASGDPRRRVDFEWSTGHPALDPRPDRQLMFRDGVPIFHRRRLKRVVTSVGGEVVKAYEFEYTTSEQTERTLLHTVRECDSHEKCKGPTAFTYRVGETPSFVSVAEGVSYHEQDFPPALVPDNPYQYERILFLDANGDGAGDLLVAPSADRHLPNGAHTDWHLWLGWGPENEYVGGGFDHLAPVPQGARFMPNWLAGQDAPLVRPKFAVAAAQWDPDGRDDFITVDQVNWGVEGMTGDSVRVQFRIGGPGAGAHNFGEDAQQRIWTAVFLDLDGDALTDALLCRGIYDEAVDDGKQQIGEVQPQWVYARNIPSVNPGFHRELEFVSTGVPCSRLDEYIVMDRDGDGTQELLVVPFYDLNWTEIPDEQRVEYQALEIDFSTQSATFVAAGLPRDRLQRWVSPHGLSEACDLYGMEEAQQAYLGAGMGLDKVLDFNGDGLRDILRIEHLHGDGVAQMSSIMSIYDSPDDDCPKLYADGWTQARVLRPYINTGRGFLPVKPMTGWAREGYYYTGDLSYVVDLRMFSAAVVTDFDADGRADLLYHRHRATPHGAEVELYAITATDGPKLDYVPVPGPSCSSSAGSTVSYPTRAAVDFNADGIADRLCIGGQEAFGAPYTAWQSLNKATHPDLLVNVRDGIGGHVIFEYALSNDAEVVGFDDGFKGVACGTSDGTFCFSEIRPIVRRMLLDDGLDADSWFARTYEYRNGHYDRRGRGWLGFSRIRIVEGSTGPMGVQSVIDRVFDNTFYDEEISDYPYAHLEKAVFVRQQIGSDAYVKKLETVYGTHLHPANDSVYAVLPEESRQEEWQIAPEGCSDEVAGVPYCTEADLLGFSSFGAVTVREFDQFGNVEFSSTATGLAEASDVVEVDTVYDNYVNTWLIGLPRTQTTTHSVQEVGTLGPETVSRNVRFEVSSSTGLVNSVTVEPGDPTTQLKTTFTRDAFGNITKEKTEPLAGQPRERTIEWDDEGVFPVSMVNEVGHIDEFVHHPGLGVITHHVDPNLVVTETTHDGFGRMVTQERKAFDGESDGAKLSVLYIGAEFGFSARLTVDGGADVTTVFDRLERPIGRVWLREHGDFAYQSILYDGHFFPRRVSVPTSVGDPETLHHVVAHDAQGRPTIQAAPNATVVTYTYENAGRVVHVTDEESRTTTYHFGDRGELRGVIDPLGEEVSYAYGAFGVMREARAPSGATTLVDYDNWGRRTSIESEVTGTRTFVVNAWGEVETEIDAKLESVDYEYDALGRLTSRSASDGTSTWHWDDGSNWFWEPINFGNGELRASFSPEGHRRLYQFDKFSRPIFNEAQPASGGSLVATYTYDTYGRPHTTTVSPGGGMDFTYRRDYFDNGKLRRVLPEAIGAPAYWEAIDYDLSGRLALEMFANGAFTAREWDETSPNLLGIVTQAGGNSIQDLEYAWWPAGSLQERRDEVVGQREEFEYDSVRRLILSRVQRSGVQLESTAAYDVDGNILFKSGVGHYGYEGSRLISAGGTAYDYDANGALAVRNASEVFEYSSIGKLHSYYSADEALSFGYDASGRRMVREDEDGSRTLYLDDHCELVLDAAGSARSTIYLTGAGGRLVAAVQSAEVDGQLQNDVYYLHDDHLGSVDAITDQQGAVVQRQSFDAWGRRRDAADWTLSQEFVDSVGLNAGFTGHRLQNDASLVYMEGRMYDPRVGRFVSADPFVTEPHNSQGMNRYAYVYNDPATLIDSSGMWVDRHGGPVRNFIAFLASLGGAAASVSNRDPYTGGTYGGDAPYRWQAMGVAYRSEARQQVQASGATQQFSAGGCDLECSIRTSVDGPRARAWRIYSEADTRVNYGDYQASPEGLSMAMDNTAVVGSAKSAWEVVTGRDAVTGEPISRAWATVGVVAGLIPGGKFAVKGVARVLGRAAKRMCFGAGTPVLTVDGLTPIEEVSPGTLVWARDEATGEEGWKPVERVFETMDQAVVDLTVATPCSRSPVAAQNEDPGGPPIASSCGPQESLRVTLEHPLWVVGRGWTAASALQEGDEIATVSGDDARVTGLAQRGEVESVYNLEVRDSHTYFVGLAGLWAHNTCVDIAREAISRLPDRLFKPLACDRCARAMAKAIKAQGVKGEVLEIRANKGWDFIVNDLHPGGQSITRNGYHEAVRVGDTVFDNYFRNGVPYSDYVRSLHAPEGISIVATPF